MLNRRGGGKQLRTNYDLRDIQVCAAAKGNNAMNHGTAQNHKYALHRRRLPPAKLNSISAALGGGGVPSVQCVEESLSVVSHGEGRLTLSIVPRLFFVGSYFII
jgi:hypothetical protein